MKPYLISIITALLLITVSCKQSIDKEAEKKKILNLMESVREAHFKKDAVLFFAPNSDSWYDVRKGQVQSVSKADKIDGTQSYLNNMEFIELKDTHPPIIEVSHDGTLASYIGAIVVKGRLNKNPIFWVVSWQSVLKKINNEWKIISTANTEASAKDASVILKKAQEAIGIIPQEGTVYAMADCKGPIGDFKTLLFSGVSDGRMEQRSVNGHSIRKHGKTNSWTFSVDSQKENQNPEDFTKYFIKAHEFHWLSLRPQDRFSNPVFIEFTEFTNRTAFKIRFDDGLGRYAYFYYDFESYLPLGFESATDSQENMVKVIFDDWKSLQDTKVFYKLTIEEGDQLWQYNFTDIKINTLKKEDFENRKSYIK
ncbi:hypothetical protein [Aquimarina sp. 2201CG5-10]|uniref:hypothetical protein n=1 Tax=Aquimarina callyspongiae TaxID=3098150 RepID=UPI002AB330ED|nr:hypothetical protein [Aquimarina sp. 2201CG5-10]MDY8136156.1 hypothetical protein [Aquimarina sp. 2201CG5-10]